MTDLFRGYDLTTVADKVAEAHYNRIKHAAENKYPPEADGSPAKGNPRLTEWVDLDRYQKSQIKAELLPLITDVLEALESDQVKPTEARQMVEYDYNNGNRSDPRWYENQDHQHSTETATVWALHLHVPADFSGENRDRILERMSILPEPTGEYTWGDSWRQWCEPPEGIGDVRLCIYFHATPDRASAVGGHLATHATFAMLGPRAVDALEYAFSTSGDYAEQVRTDQ
jgi:hypothetical protein